MTFVAPSAIGIERQPRPSRQLSGLVRVDRRHRAHNTLMFRIAADLRGALGWSDEADLAIEVGVGGDAGKVLVRPAGAEAATVRLFRPRNAAASRFRIRSAIAQRLAPEAVQTIPHEADGDKLILDLRDLPEREGGSHA